MTDTQIQQILELARQLQNADKKEKVNHFAKRMGPIIKYPESKNFLIRLMDVTFRSKTYPKISNYVDYLFKLDNSHKGLFKGSEKMMVGMYKGIGHRFPSIAIPAMIGQIRSIMSPILFLVGSKKFKEHAEKRKRDGVQLNINLIGEHLIGEEEAAHRIAAYKELLNQKEVDYISIKISTIYSQINSLAYRKTIDDLVERLSILYDELLLIQEQTGVTKFVNLDMEEYSDLSMTIDTFIETLSLPRFKNLRAGIVLQAYLPDTYKEMLTLKKWAKERVAKGGAPIKIRVVKGANLEMEKTEASLEDWPLATFSSKVESDANYKKMLAEMLTKESAPSMNVGIASHNIFDLAFALKLVKDNGVEDHIDFEMLEGMANDTVNELMKHGVSVLLYAPIVKNESYHTAIAYLVRRLDEGTQDGNFLKEGFELTVDSPNWKAIQQQFLDSVALMSTVNADQYRIQDRANETHVVQGAFKNVANTDWTLEKNRNWIDSVVEAWKTPTNITGEVIPVVNHLEPRTYDKATLVGWNGVNPWQYETATEADYRAVIESSSIWYDMSITDRAQLMKQAAVEMAKMRGDLIGVAVEELGKTIPEVDVEVSEAIDFANYYATSMLQLHQEDNLPLEDGGINLVLSPWNFPIAIPIGGVLASLAAGKRVILKPSRNAAACGYLICKALWNAGIPKCALSFMPTSSKNLGVFLERGNVFDAVILTGGTETAEYLLTTNPHLNLYAETGGKNATIVTALADRDQAAANVVQSAFGNTGQKCSATSLLVLEKEVYHDASFKALLKDAVESRRQGNPWNYENELGPLAVEISEKLQESIKNTPDSQWLVKPKLEGKFMLSPGVKWGVTVNDYEYQNELFGPILAVMCANNLQHAIDMVNGVEYGLTSGIESLDTREIKYWRSKIQAGNLYANRGTTGAIVLRQPFGGMKASCFGFGMKAGGPNYVAQFYNLEEEAAEVSLATVEKDYTDWNNKHFSKEIDYMKLRGQHNINRYLKPASVMVIVDKETPSRAIEMVQLATKTLGIPTQYYATEAMDIPNEVPVTVVNNINDLLPQVNHSTVVRALNYDRVSSEFLKGCHKKAVHVYGRPPSQFGRIELLTYLTEQNFSYQYHRYGNLLGEEAWEG